MTRKMNYAPFSPSVVSHPPLVTTIRIEHGDVFFSSCPLTGGISVPLQTLRTSNSSLSSRANVGVRRFEAVYRLVFVRA